MPLGYNGKILRVDLTKEHISIENLDDILYRRYLGGEGFVAYFLLKDLKPRVDPLSPENVLVFAAGPVTGTSIPGNGRNSVGAKSPLTEGFGEAEVGGYWGAELKHAGFDGIIIHGKASNPVYLWISDEESEIMDAANLWGKDTGESQRIIRNELGDNLIRIAQIGLGGENLVRYACIINDLKDAAGRCGLGAVMGSKNLKAIAVRGHNKLEVADHKVLSNLAKGLAGRVENMGLHKWGTGGGMSGGVSSGNLPTNNFREGNFGKPENIDARTIEKDFKIGMEGCYACPVRCKKVIRIGEPWNVDPIYGGPEYESLAALGSCCGIDDLAAVCKANEICNKSSIDSISTGVTIAFAMECFENGIITERDTDGLDLSFGNSKSMVEIVRMIVERSGLGDLLAEGVKRAAVRLGKGSEKYAIHVKGQEVPMHEPRLKRSLGLGYAVSPTGADHMHNLHDMGLATERGLRGLSALGVIEPIPLSNLKAEKVRALIYYVNWRVVDNCLLMCDFLPWSYRQKTDITRAVTGWNTSEWDLTKIGERVTTMAKIFNIREGFTTKEDWLPERFFYPTKSGPLSTTSVDPIILEKARLLYYGMMGWDEMGIPKKIKLQELDIEWTASLL